MATVVVLGAGTGGQTAAERLRQILPPSHRIVVIDRSGEHVFAPSLPWLITGQRVAAQITRPVQTMLPSGVEFHQADVETIDHAQRQVRAGGVVYEYDYLVIALGADLAMEGVPGLAQAAHHYYDLPNAQRLWEGLSRFSGGRVVLSVASTPYKCPAAPHEGALLIEAYLRTKGLRSGSEIDLYTPEPQPMPVAGPALGEAVRKQLEARGIGFHPRQRLVEVRRDERRIVLEDGEEVSYDLLVAIPPHRCPTVVREAGLTDDSGWVPVDPRTLETRAPGVFAVGDVAAVRLPNGMFLPKAGVFAHGEAEVVARRVAASVIGGEAADFDGMGSCWLETGEGEAAFAVGRFYAEPQPEVNLRSAGRAWHWGKVLFERYWLGRWPGRAVLRPLLRAGASLMGIPGQL